MEPKLESMALESPKLGKKQIETTYRKFFKIEIHIYYK